MTARQPAGPPRPAGTQASADRWRPAVPELALAAVAVAAAAFGAAAVSGWPGVVVVAMATAVLALVLLRSLVPRSAEQSLRRARARQQPRTVSGYGHRRFVVALSLTSRPMYESDLRPVLEHILAARLAERHAINLYTDPEAARSAFCRTRADQQLWPWIAPRQPPDSDEPAGGLAAKGGRKRAREHDAQTSGISRRT